MLGKMDYIQKKEEKVQMNREDLKNYKYNQIWIKDQMNYIEAQKETINRLNSTLSDMPKREQKSKRHRSR